MFTSGRPSQMTARGPNPAHGPYLFGPLSAPKYIEIHRAVLIIWPSDIFELSSALLSPEEKTIENPWFTSSPMWRLKMYVFCKVGKNTIFQNKTLGLLVMFYRHKKSFWYQFCNFKHFLKAENSEDSLASSCEEFCVDFHVTQYEIELLLELASVMSVLCVCHLLCHCYCCFIPSFPDWLLSTKAKQIRVTSVLAIPVQNLLHLRPVTCPTNLPFTPFILLF